MVILLMEITSRNHALILSLRRDDIYIYSSIIIKKLRKKLIIRLKINVLFIEIIKSKVYLRYIWDDKK